MTIHPPHTTFLQPLYHMHEASAAAIALIHGRSSRQVLSDKRIVAALLMAVEITDTAATSVPPSNRTQYPDIPWSSIIGFHSKIISADGNPDLNALWFFVTNVTSPLLYSLEQVIEPRLRV